MRVGDERSLACFTLRDSLNGVTYIMHKLETKRNQKKKRNRCRLQWDLLWFGQTKPSGARNTNSTYEANMFVCMEYGFMAKWCFRVHLIFFSFCSLSLSLDSAFQLKPYTNRMYVCVLVCAQPFVNPPTAIECSTAYDSSWLPCCRQLYATP